MNDAQLTGELLKSGHFSNRDDARMALVSCVETLGFLLPEPLIESLAAALPAECNHVLSLALFVRSRHPWVPACRAELIALPSATRQRVQKVCSVLVELLPCPLMADMRTALPLHIALALDCPERCCAA